MTSQTGTPAQLLQDLSDEADICRNEGATDIADLLDRAIAELNRRAQAQTVSDEQICDALLAEKVYPYPSVVSAFRKLLSAQSQPVQSVPIAAGHFKMIRDKWVEVPKGFAHEEGVCILYHDQSWPAAQKEG